MKELVMLSARSDDRILMPTSIEELATLSEAELTRLRIENRAWSKEIRKCMTALVNSRIANQISHEEYSASRKAVKDDREECDRKMAILGR
jgi:hypothetical protein